MFRSAKSRQVAGAAALAAALLVYFIGFFDKPDLEPAEAPARLSAGAQTWQLVATSEPEGPTRVPRSASANVSPALASNWQSVLIAARTERPIVTAHRAATNGKLTDVASLRLIEIYCNRFRVDDSAYQKVGVKLSSEQVEIRAKAKEWCFADDVRSSTTIPLRDLQEFGQDGKPLMEALAGVAPKDDAVRQRLLKKVLETGSPELLESVSRTILKPSDLFSYGLSKDERYASRTDELLVDLAIRISACTARDDCRKSALENVECQIHNSCAGDLREYLHSKVFVPANERSAAFGTQSDLSASELQQRYTRILQALHSMSTNR